MLLYGNVSLPRELGFGANIVVMFFSNDFGCLVPAQLMNILSSFIFIQCSSDPGEVCNGQNLKLLCFFCDIHCASEQDVALIVTHPAPFSSGT